MDEMIQSGKLCSLDQYMKCIQKMVKCARQYKNDDENFLQKQAELIEEISENIIKTVMKDWCDEVKKEIEMNTRNNRQRKTKTFHHFQMPILKICMEKCFY
jgi:DNA-directed RNA polymerase beta subunit